MGLGDITSNGNQQQKVFDNTYYSRLKVKSNKNGYVLGYSFKSGMLVVSISSKKEDNTYDELASIYITPTKASILAREIDHLKEELATATKASTKGYGIITGLDEVVSTLILRTEDTDAGVMPALTIGKVDANGNFVKRVDFSFNTNYDFGINWTDVDGMKTENEYFNDIEWNQFCQLITDFATASNGAYAYSVLDLGRYDFRSLSNKLNPIYDKLGIERKTFNGNQRSYSGNNFFRNSGSEPNVRTSTNKSFDEVMDSLGEDDDLPFSED